MSLLGSLFRTLPHASNTLRLNKSLRWCPTMHTSCTSPTQSLRRKSRRMYDDRAHCILLKPLNHHNSWNDSCERYMGLMYIKKTLRVTGICERLFSIRDQRVRQSRSLHSQSTFVIGFLGSRNDGRTDAMHTRNSITFLRRCAI